MTNKLRRIGAYLGSHAKAWAGLAGSAGTLAVALFPSDHRVQEIGGAIGVFATYFLVHVTPNAPASEVANADAAAAKQLGELVHVPSPELEALVTKLGYMVETATAATAAATAVVATVSSNAEPLTQPVVADPPAPATDAAPTTSEESEPVDHNSDLQAPRIVAPDVLPPSEAVEPDPVIPTEPDGDVPPLEG